MDWDFDDGDVQIALGDVRERMLEMPDESVQMIVTSPPFFGLRDYGTGVWVGGDEGCDHRMPPAGGQKSGRMVGTGKRNDSMDGQYARLCARCGATREDKQIGLEETPEEWVEALVGVFRECRRVLRKDGSLWLECGDSYADRANRRSDGESFRQDRADVVPGKKNTLQGGRKPKDLILAPMMLAFALRADGWYMRQVNIWSKLNPMPESARDRMTTAHSYVFHLAKSERYFFDADAVREPIDPESLARYERGSRYDDSLERDAVPYAAARPRGTKRRTPWEGVDTRGGGQGDGEVSWDLAVGANARSVWKIPTQPTPFKHFATFPQDLVAKCIGAGSSEHGACGSCGAPWRRATVEVPTGRMTKMADGWATYEGDHGTVHAEGREAGEQREETVSRTVGWESSCECAGAERVPCVVLDPFMGSGTTALVARKMGRRAVGFELNEEYLDIARDRLAQQSLFA